MSLLLRSLGRDLDAILLELNIMNGMKECHIVSAENYWYLGLDRAVKEEVFERLRVSGQDWIGNVAELGGTSIYGIRRYTRGAWLLGHLDHLK